MSFSLLTRHLDPEGSKMILLSSSCHHRQIYDSQGDITILALTLVYLLLVILVRRDIVVLTQILHATLHVHQGPRQPATTIPIDTHFAQF